MGFATVFLPAGNAGDGAGFADLEIAPVDRVREFLEGMFKV